MNARKQRKARREADDNRVVLKQYGVTGLTENQKEYIRTIESNRLIFCSGPAGSGKTHIATSLAVLAWHRQEFEKILIARPMVTADEEMGFLPGDINSKTHPFLRPIYDEMENYLTADQIRMFKSYDVIEVCTFGHMKGRTFKNAFIVADECQNATEQQLKMLITRMGIGSKMVVTGDEAQSDLVEHKRGGLRYCFNTLQGIQDVAFVQLTTQDIVRDPLVESIVKAMEKADAQTKGRNWA